MWYAKTEGYGRARDIKWFREYSVDALLRPRVGLVGDAAVIWMD